MQLVLGELRDLISKRAQFFETNQNLKLQHRRYQHLSGQVVLERLALHEQIKAHLNRFLLHFGKMTTTKHLRHSF